MKLKCLQCEHEFDGSISKDELGWHSSCPECGGSFDVDTCYVLTCNCYSGDNGVSVFWDERDAYKAMIDEMETEITNLQNIGYKFESAENDISAELYVPNSNIYFDWDITETTIR